MQQHGSKTFSLNKLVAFEGHNCKEIKIDVVSYKFADNPFKTIIFSKEDDLGARYFALISGEGRVRLPIIVGSGNKLKITTSEDIKVKFRVQNEEIEIVISPELSGMRIFRGII